MANFNTGLTKQQIITALTKALDSMSEQEVQDAISTAVSGKQDTLTFDSTPTSGSSNPVTSDGIHDDQQRQEAEIATKAKMDNVYGCGDAITSNSNLNDYTQPGSFYCPNSAVAGSLTNSPITNAGFRLVVESITNTAGRFIQTIHANGNDGCFYQRKQTSQGMSSWYKFEGTQVASAQSAASLMQAGRIDTAEMTDNIDNDASEKSGGEEMR